MQFACQLEIDMIALNRKSTKKRGTGCSNVIFRRRVTKQGGIKDVMLLMKGIISIARRLFFLGFK